VLIIGINAYHGDASAAVVVDGKLVAAAEEERFTRVKHSAGFPAEATRWVMKAVGASPREVAFVAVARDPWARLLRKAWYGLRRPQAARRRLKVQGRFAAIGNTLATVLDSGDRTIPTCRVEHHTAHLASSFLVSPFEEAALFSIDGLGDFASAMWGVGRGNRIYPMGAITFPHSLGLYYTAITQYLGFPKYGDEYKVMGLASYGEPEFLDEFRKVIVIPNSGAMNFVLDTDYFTHASTGAEMTWEAGEPRIGRLYSDYLVERLGKARQRGESIERRHSAIACSMQRRLEEVALDRLRRLHQITRLKKLCLAGGVAFNCVANGKIIDQTGFNEVYIQPAAGDAGLAIGAAMYQWHRAANGRRGFVMEHAYWGPEFSDDYTGALLRTRRSEVHGQGCRVRRVDDPDELCGLAAGWIAEGKIVGWFQGRMEWGPRTLGNRSILADPRCADIRDVLNAKIKRREMFRPFAPSILEERAAEYFTQSSPSPFMLMAYAVRPEKRAVVPATTHVDGTGRLQTVNAAQNPLYYKLIREFEKLTGVPLLLNTSFNENEPVVRTPEEALDCFLRTRMDCLVLGRYVVRRDGAGQHVEMK